MVIIIWICVSLLFQGAAVGSRRSRRRRLLVAVVCTIARHARTNDGVAYYFFSEMEHGSYFVVGLGLAAMKNERRASFLTGRESVLLLPLAPRRVSRGCRKPQPFSTPIDLATSSAEL